MENVLIETPIEEEDPYTQFAGICDKCGKFIHWAEPRMEGFLWMSHINCEESRLDY